MSNGVKLIISILLPLIVGFTSGFFTASNVGGWYQTIAKPSWNPPSWVFGPMWTTLYIMMGIALFLVWRSNADEAVKRTALWIFGAQLVFNFFWSFIFFYLHQPGWAFAEIIAMWVLILLTIFAFAEVNITAAWLLVPYISWVSFAGILNYTIWRINP
jgi:tryptophan-rich sensory protein